jgi:predicted ester cyclase
MSPDELKVHARRVPEELLTQGDLAVADAVFAPNLVYHDPCPYVPGVAGAKQFALALRRAFPDLCAIVEDEIAEGDTVVQRLTLSGTHRGEYCGLPPTGRRATWQLVAIQRLGPDGKVVEHWSSPDLFGLLGQLGAPLAAETARAAGGREGGAA